jgi:[CysO sulfur-carrier protein]-S-L-cysteine hydrolase
METTKSIVLSSSQLDGLARFAEDSLPNESCALLLGRMKCEVSVDEILWMNNADHSENSFSIEPNEVMYAYDLAEKKNVQIVGIFHSHPTTPRPSNTDIKFMVINPVVWLIYSTTINKFNAFIYDDNLREITISIRE